MQKKPSLLIDMIADPWCAWCYVGKRSLDRACTILAFSFDITRRYRPYQLAPEIPATGVTRLVYLKQKFPSSQKRSDHYTALRAAAHEAALDIDPAFPQRMPGGLNALRVLRWAHLYDCQTEFLEMLFNAYWRQGDDTSNPAILSALAHECGMDRQMVLDRLQTEEDYNDIRQEIDAFRKGGVNGVPTFIVNEAEGFAGALPPDQLLTVIRQLAHENALSTTPPSEPLSSLEP